MYAIIETGGKQVKVEVGQTIFVEKLDVEVDQMVTFDKVLLVVDQESKVGTPFLAGATVTAKAEKQGLSRKLRIVKYKAKSNYRRTYGHRQPYTRLTIQAINL